MGYRSDGKWVIKGPVDAITAAWAVVKLEAPPWPGVDYGGGLKDFDVFKVGHIGYIRFQYEDWKWYSSYPDVQWYEKIWEMLREMPDISGKRIRIGEEEGDVEIMRFDGSADEVELWTRTEFNDIEPSADQGKPLNVAEVPST
jgi:hypothetical protein